MNDEETCKPPTCFDCAHNVVHSEYPVGFCLEYLEWTDEKETVQELGCEDCFTPLGFRRREQ